MQKFLKGCAFSKKYSYILCTKIRRMRQPQLIKWVINSNVTHSIATDVCKFY